MMVLRKKAKAEANRTARDKKWQDIRMTFIFLHCSSFCYFFLIVFEAMLTGLAINDPIISRELLDVGRAAGSNCADMKWYVLGQM